jgi:formylglycine-generating enzyme required for sulfatase activity
MHGNVWEWCEDCWHNNYDGAQNDGSPLIKPADAERAVRGGSWVGAAWNLRSANRSGLPPDNRRIVDLGFRCARVQA